MRVGQWIILEFLPSRLINMVTIKKFCFVLLMFTGFGLYAQNIPVGMPVLEDNLRREQLLGILDSNISLMIRPISGFKKEDQKLNSNSTSSSTTNTKYFWKDADWDFKKINFSILPISWIQQNNSHHPYGWNDGAMISAKGYQSLLTAGISASYGPLSIQIKPEWVYAVNPAFEGFPMKAYPVVWRSYYNTYNYIDLPERTGNGTYRKWNAGQSNIKLNYKGFAFGISNENLWWGPSERNSLLMSNTAPGFTHLSFNTTRPQLTKIGSFEGQFIWGRLEGTKDNPTQVEDYLYAQTPLYIPKPDDWRHISGFNITYQPKWLPGLFLGLARTSQIYSSQVKSSRDVLPFFNSYDSRGIQDNKSLKSPDRYTAFFLRWLLKESHAEFYFEYGQNVQIRTLEQFIKNPDAGRAYIFGAKKVFSLAKKDQYIVGSFEMTQLGQNQEEQIYTNTNSWYTDENIRHGYTHQGQLLGAGIGPGANMQSLDITWFSGLKSFGFQVERYVHNQDHFFQTYTNSKDFRRHWVDMSYGATATWNFNNLLVNFKFAAVKSLNYQWFLLQKPGEPYWIKGRDVFNYHGRLGISYLLKSGNPIRFGTKKPK